MINKYFYIVADIQGGLFHRAYIGELRWNVSVVDHVHACYHMCR